MALFLCILSYLSVGRRIRYLILSALCAARLPPACLAVVDTARNYFGAMPPAESDGSDGSGSDIDPDEMPGEFSSTAENIAPDELPAEWFSDSAPDSAPSTPAAAAAAAPPNHSTPGAGSSPPTRPRSPSAARSYYAAPVGSTPPRGPAGPPPLTESPSRLSNRAEGAPRAGGSPEGNPRRRAGQSPWAKKVPIERDEKEEEEEDRAVRQDSLKARPLAKGST